MYDAENNNWQPGTSPFGGGSIGGSVTDSRPRVYTHYHKGDLYSRDYYTSSLGLLEGELSSGGTFRLYDWTTHLPQLVYQGSQETLDINIPVMSSNAVFFEAANSTFTLKEQVWTADGGVSDLISYGNDTSQAAGNMGTDGKDMVWTHGSNRDGGTGAYPVSSVVTAPYATVGSSVIAKRLRSEGPCIGTDSDQYVVGCGYAVHPTCAFLPSDGLLVVRIADGVSWPLVSNNTPFAYVYPVALTCDELFAVIAENNVGNIVRIRLNSLGVGLPPD